MLLASAFAHSDTVCWRKRFAANGSDPLDPASCALATYCGTEAGGTSARCCTGVLGATVSTLGEGTWLDEATAVSAGGGAGGAGGKRLA
jgi:hypothetical protein